MCLVRREVADISPQARNPASSAITGPRYGHQTTSVREAGKSPNMGLGLHRTNMVGHDPEDQSGDRYDTGLSFLQLGTALRRSMGRARCGDTYFASHNNRQDDALRQRGPPGPLARTHRG